MMPAANQGVGMNMGFPDVCLTPAAPAPIPIPYPNMGMNAMAMPFVPNVLVSMAPAQNMAAKPLMTNGDNGGVAHPMCMMPGGTIIGNPRILLGGMPASHLCVPTYGNNFNDPVGSKIVPSVTNVLLGARLPKLPADALRLLCAPVPPLVRIDGAAILALPVLGLASASEVRTRLSGAQHETDFVVDLRGNPGGSVAAAHGVAAALRRSCRRIVVLVDRATASAAELLAALLQDRGARLVGERTFGKTSAAAYTRDGAALVPSDVTIPMLRDGGAPLPSNGLLPDTRCAGSDARAAARRWSPALRSIA